MGGKQRVSRHIVEAILKDGVPRDRWFEPFVGGGSVMEKSAPFFENSLGMDAHEDLIDMWQAVCRGWKPPSFVSRETYNSLRNEDESHALRGFVGFGCSYGGKWFGGYVGDSLGSPSRATDILVCEQAYKTVMRQAEIFQRSGTRFKHGLFGSYTPIPGSVVYCDPPYQSTLGYRGIEPLDHDQYYETLVKWSELGCHVYCSEYEIPQGVHTRLLLSLNSYKLMNHNRVKLKLFKIDMTSEQKDESS